MESLNSLQQREVWFSFSFIHSGHSSFSLWGRAGVQADALTSFRRAFGGLWGKGKAKREGGRDGDGARLTLSLSPSLSLQCHGWQCQPQAFNACVCRLVCVGTVRSHCEVTCGSVVRNICAHSPHNYETRLIFDNCSPFQSTKTHSH